MFETIRNAWKVVELRKKIIFTILMLLVYRLGSCIPTPGVDIAVVRSFMEKGASVFGMLDIITGGNFSNFTVLALGVTPYITASIIVQLLTVAIPALEKLQKEGDEGRKKMNQYTRYGSIVFAFVQGLVMLISMGPNAVAGGASGGFPMVISYITVCLTLTAGTALVMWLGDQITAFGIGNGISMMIFAGIVARLPIQFYKFFQNVVAGFVNPWLILPAAVGILLIVALVVFVDVSERRIPIQYAKRMVGRKMYGGQSTHLPMKLNSSGVLPLIFAVNFVSFPGMIIGFLKDSAFKVWYTTHFSANGIWYNLIFMLLIFAFTFFYASISFNAHNIADNLKQHGGFVPGIRPGSATAEYLQRISNRITFVGALFLAFLAAVPIMASNFLGISGFGATSILILVSVALETSKQIESQLLMRHYKGFLR